MSAPLEALAAFGFIALGYPAYLLTQASRPQRDYGIMAIGDEPRVRVLTRTEKAVEAIRSTLERIMGLFGTQVQEKGDAGQYEAVELDDEPGGDLSRTQTRQSN